MALSSPQGNNLLANKATLASKLNMNLDPEARIMDPQKACLLFRLPRELRDGIYGYTFFAPEIDEMELKEARSTARKSNQLLASCRRIKSEATPVFMASNRHFWRTTKFTIPDLYAPGLFDEITLFRAEDIDTVQSIAVTRPLQFCAHIDLLALDGKGVCWDVTSRRCGSNESGKVPAPGQFQGLDAKANLIAVVKRCADFLQTLKERGVVRGDVHRGFIH